MINKKSITFKGIQQEKKNYSKKSHLGRTNKINTIKPTKLRVEVSNLNPNINALIINVRIESPTKP